MPKQNTRMLFVCHGNICRSPIAEEALRNLAVQKKVDGHLTLDSAGVAGYHIGELPHPTTRKIASKAGINLTHRARLFRKEDFEEFDWIFAMDKANYRDILYTPGAEKYREKIQIYRKFDPDCSGLETPPDVPDPYYGSLKDFEEVQQIVLRTSPELLKWALESKTTGKKKGKA